MPVYPCSLDDLHGGFFVLGDLMFEEFDFMVQVLVSAVDIRDHPNVLFVKQTSLLKLIPIEQNQCQYANLHKTAYRVVFNPSFFCSALHATILAMFYVLLNTMKT